MTDVSDSPVMSPVGAPATPVTNGLDSPAPFSRVVSLPLSAHESRSPMLHRPASSLPSIAPVFNRSQGIDAALKKLQAGLTTRTGEYSKRVMACTAQLQTQWAARHNKRLTSQTASNDILDFAGVPYTSPVEPDLPTSPSNNTAPSPSQSASMHSPVPSPLSPSRHHSGTGNFLSPSNLPSHFNAASYITDLCVHQKLNKKSQPPDGYTLLDRTISGLYRAQVNRNNNSAKVHIGFKRSTAASHGSTAPITSVSVFFRDIKEEAPFNFVAVEKNTMSGDACLHPGSFTRQPYLAYSRGEGAPLTHISLISRQHKEALPAGWNEVKVTLSGDRKADISGGSTEGAVYVCFRVDVRPIINKWRQALDDFERSTPKVHNSHPSPSPSSLLMSPSSLSPTLDADDDESLLFPYYVRLFALLSSLLYSYDSKLILFAFDVYRKLQSQHIPPQLLNLFLGCVCDATPLFLTYFQSTQHSSLLKWLMSVFKASLPVLSVDVLIKCVEVCLLLRHEDKQLEVSEAMITRVLDAVTDIHDSYAHSRAVDGAVDSDDYKDSGGNTPVVPQSPSSNNSSARAGSSTQLSYHTINKYYHSLLPIPQLAEFIVRQLAGNIAIQHTLSTSVRTYRRHHNITPHFRSDVCDIIGRLLLVDEPTIRQRKAVQSMLGSLGVGGGGVGESGRGKFSFSSIRAGDIAPEVKEETEENVRVEEASPTTGRTGHTTRDNTPPPAIADIVINLDTPSKLPSQENNTTLVNDDSSRTPSPTETKDGRELNGGNGTSFLLPPDRGSSGEDETSVSYSGGSGSQSEFLYPEFHVSLSLPQPCTQRKAPTALLFCLTPLISLLNCSVCFVRGCRTMSH